VDGRIHRTVPAPAVEPLLPRFDCSGTVAVDELNRPGEEAVISDSTLVKTGKPGSNSLARCSAVVCKPKGHAKMEAT